jgi:hypothetical protein
MRHEWEIQFLSDWAPGAGARPHFKLAPGVGVIYRVNTPDW